MAGQKSLLSSRRCGRLIFWMMFGAYAFSYLGRNTFASCLKVMEAQGLFPSGFDGYISAAYLIMYGSGQLINGFVVTKVSPKILAAVGLFGSGAVNLLMTVAGNHYLYLILWGLNGFCCAMMWPSVIAVFTDWLNAEERKNAAVNISVSIPVGSVACYVICFLGISREGIWQPVFLISGAFLLLGGTLWILAVSRFRRDIDAKIAETAAENEGAGLLPADSGKPARFTLFTVFTTGLFVMVIAAVFNGALKEAVITYVPTFISDEFHFPSDSASLFSTFLPVVAVAGPYFGKWIYKKVEENECTTIGILMGISALCNLGIVLNNYMFDPSRKIIPNGAIHRYIPVLACIAVSTACMWGVNNMLMAFTPFHYNNMKASTVVSGILNCTVFLGSAYFTVLYRYTRNAGEDWDNVVRLWAACGILCCAVCLLFAALWRKLRPKTEPKG